MKKFLISACFVVAGVFGASAAIAAGNCKQSARTVSVGGTYNVSLVNEWDPTVGGYWDMGGYYFKFTLSKGQQCTVWITGGSASDMSLMVYSDWEDANAPMAFFEDAEFSDGTIKASFLYSDAWYDDDPNRGTFYIYISGDIGAGTKLFLANGIQAFTKEGEEGNPRRITFGTSTQSHSAALIDGMYFYSSWMEMGKKYRFLVRGNMGVSVYGSNVAVEADPAYSNRTDVTSVLIYPGQTEDYSICVSGAPSDQFSSYYYVYETRLPENHQWVELSPANNKSASVQPGRIVADADKYYDAVIDEGLCRIRLNAGERWVFQTSNAVERIEMRAYDRDGRILNTNTTMGNGTNDCRTAFQASYDGYYYVGVCDPKLGVLDDPTAANVTVFAKNSQEFNGPNDSDEYDPLDDTQEGASTIIAYPGVGTDSVAAVGKPHGPHVMSGGDWYDWYCFAGRGGVTYALRASFATEKITDVPLNGVVFKDVNGVRTKVEAIRGSLSPEEVATSSAPLTFTADGDAMYYVCVYAGTGGHEYPAYYMHAMCYAYTGDGKSIDIGLVKVNTKGAESKWAFSPNGYYYKNGAVVAVVANSDFLMGFAPMPGYSVHPPSLYTNAMAWVTGESEVMTEVTGVYTDVYDPKDDIYTGFERFSPEHAVRRESRTLWIDDPEDNFVFSAKDGVYYNFKIVDKRQSGEAGDAVISVYQATVEGLETPMLQGQSSYLKQKFPAGGYLLKVSHLNDVQRNNPSLRKDTAYDLEYNSVDAGMVKFVSETVSFSEGEPYAEIAVARSAAEGVIRLNWATEAGTAKPGSEYYPANGVLEWADGDWSTKTIRIRLIPDLVAKWETNKSFAVKIWPMAEDCWADDEYGAVIYGPSKINVTLVENDARKPGRVVVRNQPLKVVAGEPLHVVLGREGGVDGDVGVVVAGVSAGAIREEDFANVQTNIVWNAGDASDKAFDIATYVKGSIDEKTLKLLLGSLKTVFPGQYATLDNPELPETSVTATIGSELVRRSLQEVDAAMPAVAMSGMMGSWYGDAANPLRSEVIPAGGMVAFAFHVTEPGFLVVHPQLENADFGAGAKLEYMISGGTIKDGSDNERVVVAVPGDANVAFRATSPRTGAYVVFSDVDGTGLPCKWIPLSSITPVGPLHGSVVGPYPTSFSWNAPPNKGGEDLWYRVRASATSASTCTKIAGLTVEDTATTCVLPHIFVPNHQFWWTLDVACPKGGLDPVEADWISSPVVWTFMTTVDGAPATGVAASARDVNGTKVEDLLSAGKPVELVQGVRIDFNLAATNGVAATSAVRTAGQMPPGVYLSGLRLYGVPSVAGDYTVIFQVRNGNVGGVTMPISFHVAPMESAAGTFCGILREDGSALSAKAARIGTLVFTASESGVLSAKASINGSTYSFLSSGYLDVVDRDDSAAGQTMKLTTLMEGAAAAADGTPCKLELEVSIGKGALTNLVALGEVAGTAKVRVPGCLLGSDSDTVDYSCQLIRNNNDSAEFLNALKPFVGYYTAAMVPFGITAADGVPAGNGIAAITVDGAGSAKASLVMADRISASSGAFVGLKGDLSNPSACTLLIPMASISGEYSFGGLVEVKYGVTTVEGTEFPANFIDSLKSLEWNKDGSKATFSGKSFSMDIRPTGGWYDTVANLQRYYLDYDFMLDYDRVDVLPRAFDIPGYTYTVNTTPHDVEVRLDGNSMSVPSVQYSVVNSIVDFDRSVNPWDVKVNFSRGSGLVQGSALVVSDGIDRQTVLGTVSHFGVLLMNRDKNSPLDTDVLTAGFYQFPASNSWLMSLPFNIRAIKADRDWTEAEVP